MAGKKQLSMGMVDIDIIKSFESIRVAMIKEEGEMVSKIDVLKKMIELTSDHYGIVKPLF